ncbi:hypothetical protein AAFN60_11820 [Roseibacillus persicicus]|uniref:hypothetical protein n=1 Tax=Roseibacillus persicicus TaxID=454148 RepID=UPI00398AC390
MNLERLLQLWPKWQWSLTKIAALGALALGILLLLGAIALPWMKVPLGPEETVDAPATSLWKTLFTLGLATALGLRLFGRPFLSMRVVCLMPVLLIAYPQAVIVFDDETSGHLSWLQQQHDTITWLGGDVFLAHGTRYQGQAPAVDMEDPPMRLAAFRPPLVAPWSLGIAEVPDLIWWLGYNPVFCQFVSKGWVFGQLGLLFLLCGWLGWRRKDEEHGSRANEFRLCAATFGVAFLVWFGLACIPITTASYSLKKARVAALNDDAEAGLDHLNSACTAMPALSFDSGVLAQKGSFLLAQGEGHVPEARYQNLLNLERDGYQHRAAELLENLIADGPHNPALDRELTRSLLRVAIDDFNAGNSAEARRRIRQVCVREPTAIQALFHLQLLALQGNHLEENRYCRETIASLYGNFQRREKKAVISAGWLMVAQGELEAGHTLAAAEAREKSRKP